MLLRQVKLTNFFGFKNFTADIGKFNVLVGPNNGGKTTLLRAVKFALDAFRLYFGNGREPNLGQLRTNWHCSLPALSQLLGIQDFTYFFFNRSRREKSTVGLTFDTSEGELTLAADCLTDQDVVQIKVALNGSPIQALQGTGEAITFHLYKVQAYFVPPLGTLTPTEQELSWPNLERELANGRYAQTWRNQLHWLNEGQRPEVFQAVAKGVRDYLGDVQVYPPRRTRDNPPNIVVNYNESEVEYDISAAGGGLRTLVALIAALELAPAPILLFDEPDAHLHSTVQRQVARLLLERSGAGHQMLIATHAPDFIDEMPVEALLWVERGKAQAERCDEVGKTLVRLGAVSNSQAMRSLGSDVVLFFEAAPDRQALTALMRRCGKDALVDRVKTALLKGFGATVNLPAALRIVKTLIPMQVAVAAIRDADYTSTHPELAVEDQGEAIIFYLPCKELENLLLLSPDTICDAAQAAAEVRSASNGQPPISPSREEVEQKIEELTQGADLRETVETQWLVRWAEPQGGIRDPGQLSKGKREFEKLWSTLEWRRRCCPGKEVLARIKQWLQTEPYRLSFNPARLFAAYQPAPEIQQMFDKLEAYINEVFSKRA
jgi:energy-coupling factor transporter ATP-binding protein EcfA2